MSLPSAGPVPVSMPPMAGFFPPHGCPMATVRVQITHTRTQIFLPSPPPNATMDPATYQQQIALLQQQQQQQVQVMMRQMAMHQAAVAQAQQQHFASVANHPHLPHASVPTVDPSSLSSPPPQVPVPAPSMFPAQHPHAPPPPSQAFLQFHSNLHNQLVAQAQAMMMNQLQAQGMPSMQMPWPGMSPAAAAYQMQQEQMLRAQQEAFLRQAFENGPRGPPPAARAAIESLASRVVSKDDLPHSCSVCQDEMSEGDVAMAMPCSHEFHKDCLLPWLQQHNSCPMCRHQLITDDAQYNARMQQAAAQAASSASSGACAHSS